MHNVSKSEKARQYIHLLIGQSLSETKILMSARFSFEGKITFNITWFIYKPVAVL